MKTLLSSAALAVLIAGTAAAATLAEYRVVAGGKTDSRLGLEVDYTDQILTGYNGANYATPVSVALDGAGAILPNGVAHEVALAAADGITLTFGGVGHDIAAAENSVTILLGVDADYQAQWGEWAIASIVFADDSGVNGENAFSGGVPGFGAPISGDLTVYAAERAIAPAPLPAAAPMLIAALGGLALLRRRA